MFWLSLQIKQANIKSGLFMMTNNMRWKVWKKTILSSLLKALITLKLKNFLPLLLVWMIRVEIPLSKSHFSYLLEKALDSLVQLMKKDCLSLLALMQVNSMLLLYLKNTNLNLLKLLLIYRMVIIPKKY